MNITNSITEGMTPQEKENYFAHMKKRHREEAEKVQAEKERLKAYKQALIQDILKSRPDFTYEELKKKPIRILEMIY